MVGAEWVIEDIAGRGVVDNSPASLIFLRGGRLAGNASCNKLIGQYSLDGMSLTVTPAGVTMMACPDALMTQERKLLEALGAVERYTIDKSGALLLTSASEEKIRAYRR
ncbi:MAG: META domain-containing protein [Pseudomonadota bacterium]